jgi:hypothetical protein
VDKERSRHIIGTTEARLPRGEVNDMKTDSTGFHVVGRNRNREFGGHIRAGRTVGTVTPLSQQATRDEQIPITIPAAATPKLFEQFRAQPKVNDHITTRRHTRVINIARVCNLNMSVDTFDIHRS